MASQSPKNYLQAISGNFGTITRYTVYLVVTATIVVLLFAVYKVTNIYIYIYIYYIYTNIFTNMYYFILQYEWPCFVSDLQT